jgi:hypothetical protein
MQKRLTFNKVFYFTIAARFIVHLTQDEGFATFCGKDTSRSPWRHNRDPKTLGDAEYILKFSKHYCPVCVKHLSVMVGLAGWERGEASK